MSEIVKDQATIDKEAADKVIADQAAADQSAAKNEKQKPVKIKFIISPTGKFDLAYSAGETCKINENQATELIEAGYAELVK